MSSLPDSRTESGSHEDPVSGHESRHDSEQSVHKERRQKCSPTPHIITQTSPDHGADHHADERDGS